MLVITGTQRSGTSMVAQYLVKMGYDVGSSLWHEDINGGYENINICNWYADRLQIPDFPFSDCPREDNIIPLKDMDLKAVKFSFLMMKPELLEIWLQERGYRKDVFIVMMRDLDKVSKSKTSTPDRRTRFKKDTAILDQSANVLFRNFHASLKLLVESGMRFKLISFPEQILSDVIPNTLYLYGGYHFQKLHSPHGLKTWRDHVNVNKLTV